MHANSLACQKFRNGKYSTQWQEREQREERAGGPPVNRGASLFTLFYSTIQYKCTEYVKKIELSIQINI